MVIVNSYVSLPEGKWFSFTGVEIEKKQVLITKEMAGRWNTQWTAVSDADVRQLSSDWLESAMSRTVAAAGGPGCIVRELNHSPRPPMTAPPPPAGCGYSAEGASNHSRWEALGALWLISDYLPSD